ncbi:MAG: YceD family protein [Nonlabens sp.]|uniref:YceD family protein n=1 Tax=Nonlabens sp. TaxID=1888209 RepID=UPI003EF20F27
MELKAYIISFVGLKQGKHQFQYEIDNTFFENFGFEEFNSAQLNIEATLDKKSTLMELHLEASGSVNVNCDVTNEPFDLPVELQMDLIIKFGQEFNDENEELLILPHGAYEFNISQYVYEMLVLGIPLKLVHPGVEDGSLDSDLLDKLEELKPKNLDNIEDNKKSTDPIWDALKKLKTDNNK